MKKIIINLIMMVILTSTVNAIGILGMAQDNYNVETNTIYVTQGTIRQFHIGVQNGANETYNILMEIQGLPTFDNTQKNITFITTPYQYERIVNLLIPLTGDAYNFTIAMRGANNDTDGQIGTMPGVSKTFQVKQYIACIQNWQCGSWTTCYANTQTRTCNDLNNCGNNTGKPPTSQSCTCNPNWTCGSWGSCTNLSQLRVCTDSNNCGVNTNKPATNQTCGCTPSWTCNSWSTCTNNYQNRTCTDNNHCNTTTNRPTLNQTCTIGGTTTGGNTCNPIWYCGNWSTCVNNKQNRTCTDNVNCNTTLNKPILNQTCSLNPQTTTTGTPSPPVIVPTPPAPITSGQNNPPLTTPPVINPTTNPTNKTNNTNNSTGGGSSILIFVGILAIIAIIGTIIAIIKYKKNNQPIENIEEATIIGDVTSDEKKT